MNAFELSEHIAARLDEDGLPREEVVERGRDGIRIGSGPGSARRVDSDLDVALLLRPGAVLPVSERAALAADLGTSAGCDVDLSVLDLDRGVVHAKEVVVNGSAVFVADTLAVARFEMSALSRYARLNEDREPVLRAYGIEATSRG